MVSAKENISLSNKPAAIVLLGNKYQKEVNFQRPPLQKKMLLLGIALSPVRENNNSVF